MTLEKISMEVERSGHWLLDNTEVHTWCYVEDAFSFEEITIGSAMNSSSMELICDLFISRKTTVSPLRDLFIETTFA